MHVRGLRRRLSVQGPGPNVVDVYVGYLRKKLGRDRIHTMHDMRYLIVPSHGVEG